MSHYNLDQPVQVLETIRCVQIGYRKCGNNFDQHGRPALNTVAIIVKKFRTRVVNS